MHKYIARLAMAVLLASTSSCVFAGNVSVQNLTLTPDGRTGAFSIGFFGKSLQGRAECRVMDGKTGVLLAPTGVKRMQDKSREVFAQRFAGDGYLSATHSVYAERGCIFWQATVANSGKDERWLEVTLNLPFRLSGEWQFWNGFDTKPAPKEASRSDLKGMFPLSAVYGNKTGLAVGIDAYQIRSYLRGGVRGNTLSYTTRMVLDPGGRDSITFVIFPFKDNFGYLDAVQHYYDTFPDVFRPSPGTDPRINLACAHYLYWYWCGKDDFNTFDLMRRAGAGNDWCYGATSGIRVGDWWPSEYTKEWSAAHPIKTPQPKDYIGRLLAGDDRDMTERLYRLGRGGEYNILPLAYTIPTCPEETMIQKYFPESALNPKDPNVIVRYEPWVYRNQNSRVVYPYGNSFGDKTKKDLERIMDEWDVAGFTLDCGVPVDPHFGKGAEVSPGKAWETGKGVYSNLGVGLVQVTDLIHSRVKNGHRLSTLINLDGAQGYYLWHAADAGIYEQAPQVHLYGFDPIHLKLMLGKKALTWWYGYNIPGVESLSKDQLDTSCRALVDYTLLYSLKMGAYPNPCFVLGVPKMISYMPVIRDLVINQGWEAAPGFTADANLWHTRYGKGPGACLVLGNATLQDIVTDITVLNSYLGGGGNIFAEYFGEKVFSSLKPDSTVIRQKVAARNPVLLRSVCAIDRANGLNAAASLSMPIGRPGEVRISIDSPDARSINASLWLPEDRILGGLTANGKDTASSVKDGRVEARMVLLKGKNELVLTLNPKIEIQDKARVLDFSFFESDQPNARILLGQNPSKDERDCAVWLNNYFDTYFRYAKQKRLRSLMLVRENTKALGSDIVLSIADKGSMPQGMDGMVRVVNGNLEICASSAPMLKETVLTLLSVLDEKYVCYGYFGAVLHPSFLIYGGGPYAKKLGIPNGYLPYFK